MPPNEAIIEQAIAQLNRQLIPKYAEVAKEFGINRVTLMRRFKGQQVSRTEATSIYCQNLTNTEEQHLLFHINQLSDRGFPMTPQILRNFVFEITKMQLQEKIKQYNILPQNTYNFDEKDFLLGLLHTLKRIVSIEALKRKHTIGAVQDGSREFISLLAGICADGTTIPPPLIYHGESRDMQDTWLEDFDPKKNQAYFAASENGWSNDEYGLTWLKQVFDPHTKQKARNHYRLLILDGHSSHINMAFIDYADQNRILLIILPPHSTHRLQPLDVGIFGPLAKAYSDQLDSYTRSGYGFIRTTKRDFWRLFRAAWEISTTAENIKSAFMATGIHPIDPARVLKKIQPRPLTPPELLQQRTPTSIRALRGLIKQASQRHRRLSVDIKKILRAGENIALDREVLLIENKNLQTALNNERRRRKREAAQRREEAKAAAAAKRCIEKQRRDEQKLQLQKEKEELGKEGTRGGLKEAYKKINSGLKTP
ncbi:predicted protein [Histoplasma mississippiense (nom. inval.)]|uniref:predicted protein n=1 Tax=Ajellomyces capsulatus (strain NAm1 / WU24) TaxID=2059318 RepID=UPI000157C868|nr:predicted protein [Histoplasma mississippiense (nom. inval.)]EDN09858.1 predicted protein [Histoplasma mississippiense (nom. inval.)]